MDLSSGVFTAPRAGIYFFDFTGYVDWQAASQARIDVAFYLNGNHFARSNVDETNTYIGQSHSLPLQSERIWAQVDFLSSGGSLYDSPSHYNHFIISQSLN